MCLQKWCSEAQCAGDVKPASWNTCSVLKTSLVEEHRIERSFSRHGWTECSALPGLSLQEFSTTDQQTAFKLLHFSEFFLLEDIMLLMDFLFFIAWCCSFLFQQDLKEFHIISSCLTLSSSIMPLNYCSYQQRNCEIKIVWLSCTQLSKDSLQQYLYHILHLCLGNLSTAADSDILN